MSSVYSILRRPHITEKSAYAGSLANSIVFEVDRRANKSQIKKAVEKVFDVKVKSVRTINLIGKIRRFKNRSGRQSSWKKAYVTLAEGSSIDLIEGL